MAMEPEPNPNDITSKMRRIGLLTSGGDAPGMNAAIRAVVRTAISMGIEVLGIKRGFSGLIDGQMEVLDARAVGGIIRQGGTILATARSLVFVSEEGQKQALEQLKSHQIEGMVIIGGDGSQRGALRLHELGIPAIGIPGSIDNDLMGTDMAIGVDTALNTAIEAIDRLKDTASAHNRAFVVEVMGRNSGYIALMAAMASGAEMVLIPEIEVAPDTIIRELEDAYKRGKTHFIVVVAEGSGWTAPALAHYIDTRGGGGFEARSTVLGHVQRGGSPTAFDRILASRLGAAAVVALKEGQSGKMVGLLGGEISFTDLTEVIRFRKKINEAVYQLAEMLAR